MPGSPFDVSDLFTFARTLQVEAGKLPGQVQLAVTETLADIVTAGKAGSPVATGFNRDSITFDVEYTADGASGAAGPESTYGGYLEHGTSRMAPRPYMGPAAEANIPKLEDRLAGLL
jgi:HK97 gp10 family phage protein